MSQIYTVRASCFATLGDLRRYKAARAQGESEWSALSVGDNGIGAAILGGYNTAQTTTPMCALPPEILVKTWGSIVAAKDQTVLVKLLTGNDKPSVVCIVADEDQHVVSFQPANGTDYRTHNGCGIDCNPAALLGLGHDPNDDNFEELVSWGVI